MQNQLIQLSMRLKQMEEDKKINLFVINVKKYKN